MKSYARNADGFLEEIFIDHPFNVCIESDNVKKYMRDEYGFLIPVPIITYWYNRERNSAFRHKRNLGIIEEFPMDHSEFRQLFPIGV